MIKDVSKFFFRLGSFLYLFFCLGNLHILAQVKTTQITIEGANSLEGERYKGVDIKKLIGNVILGHEGALMYCDSAIFYDATNSADCYGNVRIVKGDSLKMTGDFLRYDGNKSFARLAKNVSLTDSKMVLTTDTLDYDRVSDIAYYNNGARIVDKENNLVSKRGYYFVKDKTIFFKNDVRLDNPKYYFTSDTLKYVTTSKTAFFFGPTNIYSKGKDSTYIYCQNGWYNTTTDKSYFGKKAFIQSKEQRLSGDSLLYDKRNGIGQAFKNVMLKDTLQKVMIEGSYGKANEKENFSYVTGRATLTQILNKDSMFLHADTLYVFNDTLTRQKLYQAFHFVKIYKTDLQGKCDSLVYSTADSTIRFYKEPILWSEKNQLTAQLITIQLANDKISTMTLSSTAFVVSQEDSVHYNQIKGKTMTAYFIDNKMKKIFVEGNGQTVYYPKNKYDKPFGANRAECSDLMIYLDSNAIKSITMINKPDGTLFPMKEAPASDFYLKGFKWLVDLQPKRKEDIYLK